jgi:deoxycytidylate deaminase
MSTLTSMHNRATWDDTWMAIAEIMARRSPCDKRQIGAVIVSATNRVLATGYNGPPAGWDDNWHCYRDCPRFRGDDTYFGCPALHSEANALMFLDRRDCEGATLYVNGTPCMDCAKLISNSGVTTVRFIEWASDGYRNPDAVREFLRKARISAQWTYKIDGMD